MRTFLETILKLGREKKDNSGIKEDDKKYYQQITEWTDFLDTHPSFMAHLMPCMFIFDYTKTEMFYFSRSVKHLLGFENTSFLGSNGIIKFMDLINPNDFKIYNEQIFPKDMYHLGNSTYEESKVMTFSNNFRVRQQNGFYKTLLMKKCFLVHPETKMPLYEFGILLDISAFKKELSITHTIERLYDDEHNSMMKVVTEDYFPEMHAHLLSPREKEILTHLSIGTKRKEVGVRLFISDNTVANHIKTILRKTNSQNIREAIAICKMNGLI